MFHTVVKAFVIIVNINHLLTSNSAPQSETKKKKKKLLTATQLASIKDKEGVYLQSVLFKLAVYFQKSSVRNLASSGRTAWSVLII